MSVIRANGGKWRYPKTLSMFASYAVSTRVVLRALLVRHFPLAYKILSTPGNLDESPVAVIAGQLAVIRLMKRPGPRDLLQRHPQIIYRSYRKYLATSFTKKSRRAVLLHHYTYLLPRMKGIFFGEISSKHTQIWQIDIGPDHFCITFSFPGELHHEGDILLDFLQNHVPLYSLSFSIAPGGLAGSAATEVILVARVQGAFGRFDAIRQATKTCCDLAPGYLLMAAVQGIATALNVAVIAGVKNCEQVTAGTNDDLMKDDPKTLYFDYDAFWQAHLGTDEGKFYLMSVPIPEKPIELISRSHRKRTRAKRQFKNEVVEACRAGFGAFCVDGRIAPSGAGAGTPASNGSQTEH